ncbi:MAG: DUF1611 domain-containing protein [Gammaproteobacteria bacterium]|jgi:uncharacterized NAD-dependent epimerase/dehydratase family protein
MSLINRVELRKPYLVLVGDEKDPTFAKTGLGIAHWRPDDVVGQLRFSPEAVDLGVPDLDADEAARRGAGSLVIGVAPPGGGIPASWWEVMQGAAVAGLDIVSGLHTRLTDNDGLVTAAQAAGVRLIDVRTPPAGLPVGTGRKRTGKRVLTVGTDCAIGKKYTALALHEAFRAAGMTSTFRATGQTGIIIAGEGMPIDCVVADFLAGAAEVLSPDNDPDHWDVIEGQGSLFHPAYSGVSLGLLHGSQPDGFVLCHDATRETVCGWPEFRLPSVGDAIALNERLARRTNPAARCVGISMNMSMLAAGERERLLRKVSEEHGVPAVDPLIDGCATIVDFILEKIG